MRTVHKHTAHVAAGPFTLPVPGHRVVHVDCTDPTAQTITIWYVVDTADVITTRYPYTITGTGMMVAPTAAHVGTALSPDRSDRGGPPRGALVWHLWYLPGGIA